MKLHFDEFPEINVIDSYATGSISINRQPYSGSIMVTPKNVFTDDLPVDINDCSHALLDRISELQPDVLLLGTGARQVFPEPAILSALYEKSLPFEAMSTPAACRSYNVLVGESRFVVALLLPA
ncbi:MAG: hypothetical protein HKO62_12395 [Gammaproteobacteria bacterium]|nr:hypothetical protein [Gammaproteobacteria bacterium]